MSLGSRDKSALMTLPQLLKVIEENWKEGFDDLIRDKGQIDYAVRPLIGLDWRCSCFSRLRRK